MWCEQHIHTCCQQQFWHECIFIRASASLVLRNHMWIWFFVRHKQQTQYATKYQWLANIIYVSIKVMISFEAKLAAHNSTSLIFRMIIVSYCEHPNYEHMLSLIFDFGGSKHCQTFSLFFACEHTNQQTLNANNLVRFFSIRRDATQPNCRPRIDCVLA